MGRMSEIKIDVMTRVALCACGMLSKVSDGALIKVFKIVRGVITEPAAREGLDEMIDALSAGPPNTTLLRRMMSEAKYDEMRDMMSGLFAFKEMDIEDI